MDIARGLAQYVKLYCSLNCIIIWRLDFINSLFIVKTSGSSMLERAYQFKDMKMRTNIILINQFMESSSGAYNFFEFKFSTFSTR